LARPVERLVAFYNHRGTCEQYIKEGKGAVKWTRLSCRSFAANAVRLQLHALFPLDITLSPVPPMSAYVSNLSVPLLLARQLVFLQSP
jgi:hypothetical protein